MKKSGSFWEGKEPCWVLLGCSPYVYLKCPAYRHPEKPCWEHWATQCEILTGTERDCVNCKVFRRYHPVAAPGAPQV